MLTLALLLCALFSASAQVRVPFTQRTSAYSPTQVIYSINGDFAMIGNTNMTLQSYSATGLNSNNTMIKVDADGDASTNNSSSSTLAFSQENQANSSCSHVLYAGLYWTARTDGTPTEAQKRTVKFRGPGQSAYTTYTATSSNIRYPGDDNMYVGYTEVTSQVQQYGAGEYWLADMALTTGNGGSTGYYGGWGLVVVYENSLMKKRDIAVFDGYAYVVGGTASWELPVSGFTSALSGAVNTKLGLMAGEGDVTITGDKFEIQKLNTSNWLELSHGSNTTSNFFNSSIYTGGNARTPNLVNNTGMDISMFNIPNTNNEVIGNGQTSTKFRYSSTGDTYIIYSICMAVDAYEPVVEGFLSAQSVNGVPVSSSSITVLPGDQIQYKVQIRNKGNEPINNARLEIPLPYAAITYVGSSTNVYAPASTSAVPYVNSALGANGTLVWDFGTLPVPANPNDVLGEIVFTLKVSEDCDLYHNFNCSAPGVQIDGVISGVGANTNIAVDHQPFYVGYSQTGGCTTEPVTGPLNISINSSAWVAAHCPSGDNVRDFTFCNRVGTIPITDVTGFYPVGTRFFDATQTTEYTVANPFPNQAGPVTYVALLPGTTCALQFTIKVMNITSVPSLTANPVEYCKDAIATALTATPSNAAYQLFYYAPGSSVAQPFIIPSTATVGNAVYQVAEGLSSTCISTGHANIQVNINPNPVISATANQIACYGAKGSVNLSSSGGTGALSYSPSNPPTTGLTAGTYSYLVTDTKNCSATASATINPAPAQPNPPTVACYQTATWNVNACQWDVTGTQPAQPTNLACWQTASFNTNTCSWDVTGTQPVEPTNLACWQSASFNSNTCQWDVTGTQPVEPTNLSCWQSASFNTNTCSWDVTGTQPVEPTNLSCWQSASFNTNTCSWDITGTQPVEPTNLACWQTASFNTASCSWDVTGTQPAQPTNLACWQSASFNTNTCSWDITGTQPVRPTNLACWQSASFNTTTCSWDVTGTQPAQPVLACYQTATWNNATCTWDVTGSMPPKPKLECNQTATFNTVTCQWDIGTNPKGPITTTVSACDSYTWYGSVYTQSGTYNYSYNCMDYVLVLTVNHSSIAPSSINASSTSVAAGTPVTLSVNGGSLGTGAGWKWYSSSCGGTVVGTGASISVVPTTTTTYYVRAEGACNTTVCVAITITVSKNCGATGVTSSTGSFTICKGSSVTLTVQGNAGVNGVWKWNKGSCSNFGCVYTGASYRVTPTSTTTYYVYATGGTCGTTSCYAVTVTVVNPPVTPCQITGQSSGLCNAQGIVYSVPSTPGVTYNWTVPGGASIVHGQGTSSITVNFSSALSGSGSCSGNPSICVVAVNNCGSSAVRCLYVKLTPNKPEVISGPSKVCRNQIVTYSVRATPGTISYLWNKPTGWSIISGQGTPVIQFKAGSASGNITVHAVNACGGSANACKAVTVGSCCRMEDGVDALIRLYPNPSSGVVHIESNALVNHVTVLNLLGDVVFSDGNVNELDLSQLKEGLYLVRLEGEFGTQVQRIEISGR